MEALAAALASFRQESREAALNFYGEMLDDRMEDGVDEETAVAAMEAPEKIAERLAEEEKGNEAEPEKADGSAYAEKRFSCASKDISLLRIRAYECQVHIAPASDDRITLIYYSCPDDPYHVSCENGVLALEGSRKEKKRLFSISLRMLWDKPHSPGVTALIPAGTLLELDIFSRNASILCEKVSDLAEVALSTQNASVAVQDLRCKTLQAETVNASVRFSRLSVARGIAAETTNAKIEAENVAAGTDVSMTTTNGKINLACVSAGGKMILSTSNGNIVLDRPSAAALEAHTSNGSVKGTLPGKQQDWQIHSGTSNGKNSLPGHQPGAKPLSVFTSNGSISLGFEEM